jgi:hypothetical protein
MIACLVYYTSFRAINGEKVGQKKKNTNLPTSTALFAPQGLGQKRKKRSN